MVALDALIIGVGTAGEDAAGAFLAKGLSTGMVERGRPGGDCIFNACIPTKVLVTASRQHRRMRRADDYGLPECELPVDYTRVKAVKDRIVENIARGREERWRSRGAHYFRGEARFVSPTEVAVGDELIRAERIVICTGSRPATPSIPGLRETGFLTHIDALQLERLPERIAVIGAGPVGLEFAQVFGSLGASVTIFEAEERILPREDEDVSAALEELLRQQGITPLTSAAVSRVSAAAGGKEISFSSGGRKESREFDEILVATGRKANMEELNLEAAGVDFTSRGITVDAGMRTNVPHIWAAGDVTGLYQFTLIAWEQGSVAAANAVGEGHRGLDYGILPRVTFCDPEVASVGLSEREAREAGNNVKVGRFNYADLSLALASGETDGFCKIIAGADSGLILGGHIIGAEAGSLIHEIAAAMAAGLTARRLGDTLHAYPTYSEGIRYACQAIGRK